MSSVIVRNIGRVSYSRGLEIQKELVQTYKNKQESKVGVVLLCEHAPPVYTVGLRHKDTTELQLALRGLGADIVKTRRGGLVTFHGVGQLVCYPVINLHRIKVGVREYVKRLEQSVIRTSAAFGIQSCTTEHTGVWVGDNKLCAIGIQVSMGVAYHGLALNCTTDLSWFDHIVPCGIEGKGVTSLTQLAGTTVSVDQVSPVLVDSLCAELNLTVVE